jgi:hypothetical protein
MSPQTYVYDEKSWLVTLTRSLREYIEDSIDDYVRNNLNQPSGLDVYEIVFDFPSASEMEKKMPLSKSIIHLIVDDIDNQKLGFGSDVVNWYIVEDEKEGVYEEEAVSHVVNFDVGIWTTDKTGGSTARLMIYQMLHHLFYRPAAQEDLKAKTQGVDVMRFSGGRFIQETINDITVFRLIDSELIVKIFSRTILKPSTEVTGFDLNGGIFVDDEVIVDTVPE